MLTKGRLILLLSVVALLSSCGEPVPEGPVLPSLDGVDRWRAAWNEGNGRAVAAALGAGTYADPAVPGGIAADALVGYADTYFTAAPDVVLDTRAVTRAGENKVLWEWTFAGTNTGPLGEASPTNRWFSLPGVDVIELNPDGSLRRVDAYFDRQSFNEQLGLM